ncbi:hypothetical protein Pmani_022594 [Petrolisthes manimaculis]|uniref:Neurotransmitter-gated ion-channel ligand-binding domain-containing protein n=1 Tax=Petrolisthes manimaculis TaxID=1843537 RepID=A0AAE1PCG2_9EUCA|nr:hypothetical protein Pmani_022594 [Petrolisthes manimaculis]
MWSLKLPPFFCIFILYLQAVQATEKTPPNLFGQSDTSTQTPQQAAAVVTTTTTTQPQQQQQHHNVSQQQQQQQQPQPSQEMTTTKQETRAEETEKGDSNKGMVEVKWVKEEAALRKKVFRGYDKHLRPTASNLTIVVTSLDLLHLRVMESQQSLQVQARIQMTWEDRRLTWSLAEHEDLDRLGVEPADLWRPDLALQSPNSNELTPSSSSSSTSTSTTTSFKSEVPALVYPNGDITVAPRVRLDLECSQDLTLWPHDTLTCYTLIGSWVHLGHMLNFTIEEGALQIPEYRDDGSEDNGTSVDKIVMMRMRMMKVEGGWVVKGGNLSLQEHHHPCCYEPRTFIALRLLLQRQASTFAWLIRIPVVCLTMLCWVVFILPPGAGEKVILGMVNLLLHLLYLALTAPLFSHAAHTTPLLVRLVMQGVVLCGVSVVVSGVVVRLARYPHSSSLPAVLTTPILALASLLCLNSYARRVRAPRKDYAIILKGVEEGGEAGGVTAGEGDHYYHNHHNNHHYHTQPQWFLLAAILDRVCLFLYLAICVISLLSYSTVL